MCRLCADHNTQSNEWVIHKSVDSNSNRNGKVYNLQCIKCEYLTGVCVKPEDIERIEIPVQFLS